MDDVLTELRAGDLRTTGASDAVSVQIEGDQALFDVVFAGLEDVDPGLRMRCSDALEKASRRRPERLTAHKSALLGRLGAIDQQEVQWHVAQMLPRLGLSGLELVSAVRLLERYLNTSRSAVVRANALDALAKLADQDPCLLPLAQARIERATKDSSAAVRARGRHLDESFSDRSTSAQT
jgi:HEAT repeat protein